MFYAKKSLLEEKMDENLEEANVDYEEVIGLGDDSLSDLLSHIVGCGQKEYELALKEIDVVIDYREGTSERKRFKESFYYSLHGLFDIKQDETDKNDELLEYYIDTPIDGWQYIGKFKDFDDMKSKTDLGFNVKSCSIIVGKEEIKKEIDKLTEALKASV